MATSPKQSGDGRLTWPRPPLTSRLSRDQAVAELRRAGVPAVPVSTAADRAREPRYRDRRTALHEGAAWLKGFPLILHGFIPPAPFLAPALGEDVQSLDDEQIAEMLGRPPQFTHRSAQDVHDES